MSVSGAELGDETFDVLDDGLSCARRELLDLAQLSDQSLILRSPALRDRRAAEKLIDCIAEGVGDRGDQMGRRVIGLRFVVLPPSG